MFPLVLGLIRQCQVTRDVIQLVPVNVMNYLVTPKCSPELIGHDYAMLTNPSVLRPRERFRIYWGVKYAGVAPVELPIPTPKFLSALYPLRSKVPRQ